MRTDVSVAIPPRSRESAILASPSTCPESPNPGGAIFGSPTQRRADCAAAQRRRYLVAQADRVQPGELRRALDEAIEGALALRGALPPAVALEVEVQAAIHDQLFRIRALGARGLTLCLPSLTPAADESGMLQDQDARVLYAWLEIAQDSNVEVLLDEVDRGLTMRAPRSLDQVVSVLAPVQSDPDPVVHSEPPPPMDDEEDDATHLAACLTEVPDLLVASPASPEESDEYDLEIDLPDMDVSTTSDEREGEVADGDGLPESDHLQAAPHVGSADRPADSWADGADLAARMAAALGDLDDVSVSQTPEELFSAGAFEPELDPATEAVTSAPRLFAEPSPAIAPPAAAPVPAEPESQQETPDEAAQVRGARIVDAAEWRTFALELDAARGPKPVSAIERLFRSRYVPLLSAEARGETDAAVSAVIDEWRTSFAQSYLDSFSALRVTGRRPPMVLDAPELAARIGRLNGARMVKLLMVDCMSFELGERVAHRLRDQQTGRAVCVERTMLWAALPSNTPTQMTLLSKGPGALSDPQLGASGEPDVARGRAVSTLRRTRIGQRELMKLDLVESRLQSAGPEYDERMEGLADEVSDVIGRYVDTLPSRTLLFVFGDHGFQLQAGPNGWATGAATQGGASPEEVLVSGHAWLVDGMH